MDEIKVVSFLHQLRIRVLSFIALENVIVRFEVDDETPKDEITLAVIFQDKYLRFLINDDDLKKPNETLEFVMKRIYKEVNLDN